MARRTCAGKPDGTPCGAPALIGSAFCRHHGKPPAAPPAETPAAAGTGEGRMHSKLKVGDRVTFDGAPGTVTAVLDERNEYRVKLDAAETSLRTSQGNVQAEDAADETAGTPQPLPSWLAPGGHEYVIPLEGPVADYWREKLAALAPEAIPNQPLPLGPEARVGWAKELRKAQEVCAAAGDDDLAAALGDTAEAILKGSEPIAFVPVGPGLAISIIPGLKREGQTQSPTPTEAQDPKPHPLYIPAIAEAPNHGHDRALYRALGRKGDPNAWPLNAAEGYRYFEDDKATVLYIPDEEYPENWYADEALRRDALQALDRRFREMRGILTADTLDILYLHWLGAKVKMWQKIGITLAQLCQARGIKPRRKALEQQWQAVRDVRALRLRGGLIEDAAVLEMDAIRYPQLNLFGSPEPPSADLALIYSPGPCVAHAMKSGPFYLAGYTPRFLRLDPHQYGTAKRLARYLRGEWRLNPEGYVGETLMPAREDWPGAARFYARRYRTWREHFTGAGIDPERHFEGCKRHSEALDALDQHLKELVEVRALGQWTPDLHRPDNFKGEGRWEAAAALYHPEDRERLLYLPPQKKLQAFLSLRVHLPIPEDLQEHLRRQAEQREKLERQQEARDAEAEVRRKLGSGHPPGKGKRPS